MRKKNLILEEDQNNSTEETISEEELNRLRARDNQLASLEKQAVEAPDAEKKKLEEELKKFKEESLNNDLNKLRAEMESYVADEVKRQNEEDFGGFFKAHALEDESNRVKTSISKSALSEAHEDTVHGKKLLKRKLAESLQKGLKKAKERYEEFLENERKGRIENDFDRRNLNVSSPAARQIGQVSEEVYGSAQKGHGVPTDTKIRNYFVTKALGIPVVGANFDYASRKRAFINDLVHRQLHFNANEGIVSGHMLSPGGMLHNILSSNMAKQRLAPIFEADEVTTTSIVGALSNLPSDVSGALVELTFARAIMADIAAEPGTMNAPNGSIYERHYPRSDEDPARLEKHYFGHVDHALEDTFVTGSTALADGTTVADAGAFTLANGEPPQRIYATLHEVVDGNWTLKLTGLSAGGSASAECQVTFTATDAVGTTRECIPVTATTKLGTRFYDITAVDGTGAPGSGQVSFWAQSPITGAAAGSRAKKTGTKFKKYSIDAEDHDLESDLPLRTIEDMASAMAAGGGSPIDIIGLMIQINSEEMVNFIDGKGFMRGLGGADSANVNATFDATTVPADYAGLVEWRRQIHRVLDETASIVQFNGGVRPNWMIWHSLDKPHIVNWLGENDAVDVFKPEMNDPFTDSRAQYRIANQSVYISENTDVCRILHGSSGSRTGLHYKVYVPFALYQAQDPTAAFQTVTMLHQRSYVGVTSGKSLGVTPITR